MSTLHILWDESYIWGLLAVRAAKAMNLPFRIIRAADILQGILKKTPPALLLVPGGNARHKARRLTLQGIQGIREYVAGGGQYLGFCGGAGLALSGHGGLDLCPWQRAGYDDRLQHFMSGHLYASLPHDPAPAEAALFPDGFPAAPRLPVWWPGRFGAAPHPDVRVLATYQAPAEDFWLADLPISDLPPETFTVWQDMYGLSLSPSFLAGQPCVVHGAYGGGAYTLSYSHLETPHSPHANRWLAHLLHTLAGLAPSREALPPWRLRAAAVQWDDPTLATLDEIITALVDTGISHTMLFERNEWLLGWRTGIPGANLNNLWAAIKVIREHPPAPAAEALWRKKRRDTLQAAAIFHSGCTQYLLAERLAMTLAKSFPEAVPAHVLKEHRASLFGAPMEASGFYRDLMAVLDDLAFLQMQENTMLSDSTSGQY